MEKTKVFVTGLGMVTSLGESLEKSWQNLIKGKSGIGLITLFDPSNNATKIAGQIPLEIEERIKTEIPPLIRRQMTRITKFGYVAAKDAIDDSGIDFEQYDKTRCAVITGIVQNGFYPTIADFNTKSQIVKEMPNALGAWISLNYGLKGPSYPVSTACATTAYAIAVGCDLIRVGKADVVVVGGADSHIEPSKISGFNEIFALSMKNENPEKASRPFTKSRSGFVMGEGAGFLILESEKSAIQRNARVYVELSGYSLTSEAFNIVSPQTDGSGMAITIENALLDAGVSPGQVDYINAHGTSTNLNDKYETFAIKKVFKDKAKGISISSSKSMIGHTIGAAGVIEAVITILSIYHGKITPTINYDDPDPELDLDYTPNISKEKNINVALSNSFGFGGHNATIVFNKYCKK